MKKSLIAMSVAAIFAAPMAANAEGTVYGQLQAEITQVDDGIAGIATGDKADGSTIQMADNARGRIGFKGSEELGNGMTMIGKMEFKVDTADGDSGTGISLQKREMMVGLKDSWGTFSMGRLKSPYKYAGGVKYDAFVTTALEARGVTMTGKVGQGNAQGHNSFQSDSIGLSLMGGKLKATIGVDEVAGTQGDITIAYKHAMGKKNEIIVAHTSSSAGTAGQNDAKSLEYSSTKVGGKFGPVKFQLETGTDGTGTADVDHTMLFVAYGMKMAGGKLIIQGGTAGYDGPGTAGDVDVTDITIGYMKKFTKSSRWFAGYRTADIDADGTANDRTQTALTYGMRFDY